MTEEVRTLKPPYRIVRDFEFAEIMYLQDEVAEAVHGFALGILVSVFPGEDQETTLVYLDRQKALELRDRLNALLVHSDTHH